MASTETTLQQLLGPRLVTSTGEEIDTDALAQSKKSICLYFSAHWCGPCRGFTPKLSKAFADYKSSAGEGAEMELVFVSWDNSADQFKEYHAEMPFPAVPYDSDLRKTLGDKFKVEGIPALQAINSDGSPALAGEDLRALVTQYGPRAFPFTSDRLVELKAEATAAATAALKQLHTGEVPCDVAVQADGLPSSCPLSALLGDSAHVGLVIGDGDASDGCYQCAIDVAAQINSQQPKQLQLVYVGWELYNDSCDHNVLAAKFGASIVSPPESLKAALKAIATASGGFGSLGLMLLRRGSGLCGMDGKCEEEGAPVLVSLDGGLRHVRHPAGASAFPWTDEKMAALAAEQEQRIHDLRQRQTNLAFLEGEGGKQLLVKTEGDAPTVPQLAGLGPDAVIGLYFSAHWCGPCRSFTPQLVKCYEHLQQAGKSFEVVFISSDKDQAAFDDYLSSMVGTDAGRWAALAYEHRQLKSDLSQIFEVQGIPTLILLGSDGRLISADGRQAVGYGAEFFPWDEEALKRGAQAAQERAARQKEEAVKKEQQQQQEQEQAGGPVVLRLRGEPGCIDHDVSQRALAFASFSTAGAPAMLATSGVLYVECEVLDTRGGIPQIGFAQASFEPQAAYSGEGVGDDKISWGVDGVRQVKWHGEPSEWKCEWQKGDIVGLAANIDEGKIAVSKNGSWQDGPCGVVFCSEGIKAGVFPCFTAGGYTIRYTFTDFKYTPPTVEVWAGTC